MLNIEDFKEEMIKKDGRAFGVEIATHKVLECGGYNCGKCLFHGDCRRKRRGWLLSEKKDVIVLTKFEHSILEWLYNECYEYIARDRDGDLRIFCSQPHKMNDLWDCDDDDYFIPMFNKLFEFINWEDTAPVNIDNLLSNCEVLENEQ